MNRQLLPLVVGLGLLVLACSLAPQAEIGPTPAVTVTKRVIVTPKVTPTSPPPTVAAAQTVRVAADGSGDYETLVEAIEEVGPGSTIFLAAGTYELRLLPLKIDKPLTLIGAGRDTTRRRGVGRRWRRLHSA